MRQIVIKICLIIYFIFAYSLFTGATAGVTIEGDLPRRAELGFEVTSNNDRLQVSALEAGSAAALAGLQAGDRINIINGTGYHHDIVGRDLLRRLDGDKEISFSITRNDNALEITFTPPARPFEDPDGVVTSYGSIRVSGDAHLRTVLSYKEGAAGPLPVVMLIQWVSCGSVDGNMVPELWQVLENLPVAILRVERSANGDSEGPACHELDYNTEIQHYTEAALMMARHPMVDASKIYLYGSSLGSTVAPLVAQRLKREGLEVAGLMIQGGGAVTYFERMLTFDRQNLERRDGRVFENIHEELLDKILFQTEYLIKGRHPDDIAADSETMALVRESILGLGKYNHYGRPFAWHQQAATHDFLEAWLEVNKPSLIAFAEYDQFEGRHGHQMIADVMNRVSPGVAEFVELPALNHFNDRHSDIDQAYFRAPGTPAIEILAGHMVRWLNERLTGD